MTTQQIPISPAHAAILAMPQEQLQQGAMHLWDALWACHEELKHQQLVLGGWEECDACQSANDNCDGRLACDTSKQRRRVIERGWTLR